jgi:hypothetical protein
MFRHFTAHVCRNHTTMQPCNLNFATFAMDARSLRAAHSVPQVSVGTKLASGAVEVRGCTGSTVKAAVKIETIEVIESEGTTIMVGGHTLGPHRGYCLCKFAQQRLHLERLWGLLDRLRRQFLECKCVQLEQPRLLECILFECVQLETRFVSIVARANSHVTQLAVCRKPTAC